MLKNISEVQQESGFILGTRKGVLYQIMLHSVSKQITVRCLHQPVVSGMLAGLGRMLWGQRDTPSAVRSLIPKFSDSQQWYFFQRECSTNKCV